MDRAAYVRKMAEYNRWMNDKVYASASGLPAGDLAADRGAFFGSILGTLNHLLVADTIWLKRFAAHPARYAALAPFHDLPAPAGLDAQPYPDFAQLRERRRWFDERITAFADAVTEAHLDEVLHYSNSMGPKDKRFFGLLVHFFNHQTHHRGQVSTLLSQAGLDVGATDLLLLIPDEAAT